MSKEVNNPNIIFLTLNNPNLLEHQPRRSIKEKTQENSSHKLLKKTNTFLPPKTKENNQEKI